MARKVDVKALSAKFSTAGSAKSQKVHVVPSSDGWNVKREGAIRASVVKATKEDAVKAAKELKSVKRIIIHRKDGTIMKNTALK
jgi:Uncharacterized protein conserved in bacteria (DUF2188)